MRLVQNSVVEGVRLCLHGIFEASRISFAASRLDEISIHRCLLRIQQGDRGFEPKSFYLRLFRNCNKVSGNQMRVLHRYGPYVRPPQTCLATGEYTLCVTFDTECRFEEYDNIFDRKPRQQGICWKFTLPTTERAKSLDC